MPAGAKDAPTVAIPTPFNTLRRDALSVSDFGIFSSRVEDS
jgi:hypothetical protein